MRKPTTLMAGKFGSRHFGTKPFLADALRLTGKDKPIVLYLGVANGDNREFGAALSRIVKTAGAHKVLWPKLAGVKKNGAAREALEEADLVFVGASGEPLVTIDEKSRRDTIQHWWFKLVRSTETRYLPFRYLRKTAADLLRKGRW